MPCDGCISVSGDLSERCSEEDERTDEEDHTKCSVLREISQLFLIPSIPLILDYVDNVLIVTMVL